MSNPEDEKLGPRWSQLHAIITGIQTIFPGYASNQMEFGIAQLYQIGARNMGTFVQPGYANESQILRVKIVAYINYLRKNGSSEFDINMILKGLDQTKDSILCYEKWRNNLPENERDLHVQFDLTGLDELLKTVKYGMSQVAPPTRRPDPMTPNKVPIFANFSTEDLLQICRNRNIIVPPSSENDRLKLMKLIDDNAEY